MADRDQDPVGDAPINPTSGLRENRSGIVDGATGGTAMGDEGIGDETGGIAGGHGSVGGAGGGQGAGGGMSGGVDDVASRHGLGLGSSGNAQGPKKGIAG